MGDHLQDEFDVYFARAAAFVASAATASPFPSSASTYTADSCSHPLNDVVVVDYGRHDSLPDIEISLLLDDDLQDSGVQPRSPVRTSSCRYPQRKRAIGRRKGSVSPSVCSFATCASPSKRDHKTAAAATEAERGGAAASAAATAGAPSKESPRCSLTSSGSSRLLVAPNLRQEPRCCHSAPHSRSSSWKKIKRPVSFRDLKEVEHLELDDDDGDGDAIGRRRTRVSLEDAISAKLQELKLLQADDCYVVRQFTTSPKGAIVNRGDSIKRRASSSTSTASKSPTASPVVARSSIVGSVSAPDMPSASASAADGNSLPSLVVRGLSSSHHDDHDEHKEKEPDRKFHVLVLGDEGVGKTSLLQQFMTSEYMAAVQTSFGK